MEQAIRQRLKSVVTQCRKLLEESVSHELEGRFGVHATKKGEVQVDPAARMTDLTTEEKAARINILAHLEHIKARGFSAVEAREQLVREVAFTHLNRLCAYKMMEAREIYVGGEKFRDAVGRGFNSNGFKFYLADHPEDERLSKTGKADLAYRHFLDGLGRRLSEDIGVLFSPTDSANQLYPHQTTLNSVVDLLNGTDIKPDDTAALEGWPHIWKEDETIGWVYQYFNPKDLRDRLKKCSKFPRTTYEITVRSSYFTPRFVVQFLTENTLGRVWYEMRKGNTKLAGQCSFLVRPPSEVFLAQDQEPPSATPPADSSKERVYVPHRPKKDPRDLRILDPACGSGHFLLCCFDLLLAIYDEAYSDPDLGPALKRDYPTPAEFSRAVPGLILARNLHGIDIDLRCSQIAALALWLRCHRAYREMGLKADRPRITRSNFVCAEPMPGEGQFLQEFLSSLQPRLLAQLVKVVFDRMSLAGLAGSLLKVEEEIAGAIAEAKRQWLTVPKEEQLELFSSQARPKPTQLTLFDVRSVTDGAFWTDAEAKVFATLQRYVTAASGDQLARRLFADDAERGFGFVDLCRTSYDVVLMNPPYAETEGALQSYLKASYPATWTNLYSAFIERTMSMAQARVGFVCPDGFLSAYRMRGVRRELLERRRLEFLSCLGRDVFEDMGLSTIALVVNSAPSGLTPTLLELGPGGVGSSQRIDIAVLNERTNYILTPDLIRGRSSGWTEKALSPTYGLVTKGNTTFDDVRFVRAWWEVSPETIGVRWQRWQKGGDYQPFVSSTPYVIDWDKRDDGASLRAFGISKVGTDAQVAQSSRHWWKAGLVGPAMNTTGAGFNLRVLPRDQIFSAKSTAIIPTSREHCLILLALVNSRTLRHFLYQQGAGLSGNTGKIKKLPIVWPEGQARESLIAIAAEGVGIMAELESFKETSPFFRHCVGDGMALVERYKELAETLDVTVAALYQQEVEDEAVKPTSSLADAAVDEATGGHCRSPRGSSLLSYLIGIGLGRWDIRFAMDTSLLPELPDPFEPLPAVPAGQLIGPDGLAARAGEIVSEEWIRARSGLSALPVEGAVVTPTIGDADYPATVCWDGIMPDDPEHPHDIVRLLRNALEVIWREDAASVEKEMCQALGVKDLRDNVRNPGKGGAWLDHITRYSKSRRKAPIYWLLQSSRRSYALWLYYHKLDKDILFKALQNYVEPKIRLEVSRLETLRTQKATAGESGREAKRLGKAVEEQDDLVSELRDFEDRLRRAANLHFAPDLNDGVSLNIAPLHELVPWEDVRSSWDEVIAGEHEWSSLGKQLRAKGLVK